MQTYTFSRRWESEEFRPAAGKVGDLTYMIGNDRRETVAQLQYLKQPINNFKDKVRALFTETPITATISTEEGVKVHAIKGSSKKEKLFIDSSGKTIGVAQYNRRESSRNTEPNFASIPAAYLIRNNETLRLRRTLERKELFKAASDVFHFELYSEDGKTQAEFDMLIESGISFDALLTVPFEGRLVTNTNDLTLLLMAIFCIHEQLQEELSFRHDG